MHFIVYRLIFFASVHVVYSGITREWWGLGLGGIAFFRKIKSFLRIGDFCRDLVTGIILPGELFWFEQSVKTNDGLLQLKYLILVT